MPPELPEIVLTVTLEKFDVLKIPTVPVRTVIGPFIVAEIPSPDDDVNVLYFPASNALAIS